jgi:hypothetical protein
MVRNDREIYRTSDGTVAVQQNEQGFVVLSIASNQEIANYGGGDAGREAAIRHADAMSKASSVVRQ